MRILVLTFLAEFGFEADVREDAVVLAVRQAGSHALGAISIPLDPQRVVGDADMGGVICAGGDKAEAPGVEQLTPHHAGEPGFTLSLAVRPTQGAKTRLGRIAAVHGSKYIVAL
jgi:hypothetical protein